MTENGKPALRFDGATQIYDSAINALRMLTCCKEHIDHVVCSNTEHCTKRMAFIVSGSSSSSRVNYITAHIKAAYVVQDYNGRLESICKRQNSGTTYCFENDTHNTKS